MIRLLTVLAALWLSGVAVLAQDPSVDVEVEPFVGLTVGDQVSVRVTIAHEAGERVVLEQSLVDLGGVEPAAPVITEIDETRTLIVFRTRSFTTGEFPVELPPIPIRGVEGEIRELAVGPVLITVGSVLTEDTQPRPNTAPDLIEGERRTFTPWIVAIIGVGIGFVVARTVRRWKRRAPAAASAQPTSADMPRPVALAMDESRDPAEQCRQLAASVRGRLSADWSLPASALTASEIGPALSAAGASGVVVLRVTRLLEACDRVQFGGEQPTPERLRRYRQLAEAIWEDDASS
ncbi:MAG: hypothetical protein OXH38_01325 [Chloroflexi bacterium]|nr:hypothetical protein [Chloroflexota bacterium]